ncbi:hypothetical protein Aerorivi_04674 (plasmid) [Aeromonas rivipollensis]
MIGFRVAKQQLHHHDLADLSQHLGGLSGWICPLIPTFR